MIAGSILLLVLLISIFVLTLSCALGWVVAKISLKLKNKSFITVADFPGLLRLFTISSASEPRTIIQRSRRQRRYLRRKNQGCGVSDLSVRLRSAGQRQGHGRCDGRSAGAVCSDVAAAGPELSEDRNLHWQDGASYATVKQDAQRQSIGRGPAGQGVRGRFTVQP